MPNEATPKKAGAKGWELAAVFILGGAAGFYVSRMFGAAQANGNPGHLAPSPQHWHSSKLQITAPGYAGADTSDAAALAELEQPELYG